MPRNEIVLIPLLQGRFEEKRTVEDAQCRLMVKP